MIWGFFAKALSVTYLGYLRSTGTPVVILAILITRWACLLATVALGLFYSFLHSHYRYYARMREYQDALSNQKTAESVVVGKVPIVGLPAGEYEQERARLRKKADAYTSFARDLKKKEDRYYWMWRRSGFAARLLFVVGLVCLFIFAKFNALQQPDRGSHPVPCGTQEDLLGANFPWRKMTQTVHLHAPAAFIGNAVKRASEGS